MSKKLFNNIFLKIISIILAFVAWLILVNISDPTTSITVSGVNVRFENETALSSKGYTYEVLDGGKISVELSGPKTDITSVSAADIDATVDLAAMSPFSDYADISVKVVKDGNEVKSIKATPKTSSVKLKILNRNSVDYTVEPEAVGDLPEGYALSDVTVTPASVRIAGSQDDVDKIDTVKAVFDVSGKTSDISEEVKLKFFDSDGEEITETYAQPARDSVNVSARIAKTKTVKIHYETTGSPAPEHTFKGVELSNDTVTISGSDDVLSTIEEFVIPAEAIDITDLSYSKTYKIWLPDYAPEGVSVVSDTTLRATVYIEED